MSELNDALLHAYVDGQLEAARRAEVEAMLATDTHAAERVAAYRKQNEMLHALFDPALVEARPERLRRARPRPNPLPYAAMLATLGIGLALGYFARGALAPAPTQIAWYQEAAFAHVAFVPEVLHPVEVSATQETHLVNWLSKRLGAPLRAPHLQQAGFELMGGRLLPAKDQPAAQFMYQDSRGQRLTLYVKREQKSESASAFRYATEEGLSVFYWVDRDFGYALSGNLPKADLLRVAETVYKQLNP